MDTWANNWVDSYLEALLSYGLSTEHAGRVGEVRDEIDADKNVHAAYYLQQIMGLDEGGLWEAWNKASSTKIHGSKDSRLEYLSWRVWGMKQRNVRVRNEEKRRILEEQDAVVLDDDEASDEEDVATPVHRFVEPLPSVPTKPRVNAGQDDSALPDAARFHTAEEPVDVSDSFEQRVDKLYVVLISIHGLVRGERMELGKDPDTGGQVKYVVELARALSEHPAVHRVDLLTRLIKNPDVDEEYGVPEECIKPGSGKKGGAYIVRLPCGPVSKYIRKEELWPHVREFADNGIAYVRNQVNTMLELGERCELYTIHGHYADAGEIAATMAQTLGVDMVLTGHSLGRNKLEHLIASSKLSLAAVEKTYNISRRIEGEERALDEAIMVFTSTQQEVNEQWGLYNGYEKNMQEVSRRRKGPYHIPAMRVIPPGLDFSSLKVDLPISGGESVAESSPNGERVEPPIWQEIAKFLQNPRKPVILAMSRPDAKKNIASLVTAFGSNNVLKELANLVLIMGNRDVIDSMVGGSKNVLEQVLKLIDSYDLYGKVAYPKRHKQSDVSDIYHLPAATKGVFVNIALQEPFGLTLIEAGAHGVPIVATQNGGPVDIIHTLQNGILVNPTDTDQIANALLTILTQKQTWDDFSRNGVGNIMAYSWPAHCKKYLENIEREKKRRKNIKQITAFSGSWDNSKFNTMVDKAEAESGNPMALVGSGTPKLVDDTALDFDMDLRMAEEERDAGAPRMAVRERIYVFTLDNQPMAKQALKLVRGAIKAAYHSGSETRDTSLSGFGIASMMSYDMTCTLLDYEAVDVQDIDFIIVNGGADVFVWAGHEDDMVSYDPYDMHISVNWDKLVVQRLLERIWKDGKKEKRLLKHIQKKSGFGGGTDTGPNHILMEIEKESKQNVDDVAVVDRIRAQLRNHGVRAQTVLQVDKTSAGKQVAPLLHVIPVRASRALAMRFLFHRLNIGLDNVVVVCVASSLASTEAGSDGESESRKVGFVVSDMYDIVGGKQKVIIVPPTDETRVRVPTDRLDAQMIEKLKLQCGPDVYDYRVVLLQEAKTKYAQIAEYLTV